MTPNFENVHDFKEHLRRLAYDHGMCLYHSASRSYIHFAPWMEPFYAKGIGNFANDAFVAYMKDVESMLNLATDADLQMWLETYEETHNE